MCVRVQTTSPQETLALGRVIGARLPQGTVVGLDGPLGAGKTWMAKGLVQGIGTFDPTLVKSPAYNLIHEYQVDSLTCTVYHIDFYRLDRLSLPDRLLFSEVLDRPDAICLIEWAGKFLGDLVPAYLSITVSKTERPDARVIHVRAAGDSPTYESLLRDLHHDVLAPY